MGVLGAIVGFLEKRQQMVIRGWTFSPNVVGFVCSVASRSGRTVRSVTRDPAQANKNEDVHKTPAVAGRVTECSIHATSSIRATDATGAETSFGFFFPFLGTRDAASQFVMWLCEPPGDRARVRGLGLVG